MTDNEFERLWQRAEATPHAEKLAEGYDGWRARNRRALAMTVAMAVMVAAAVPLFAPQHGNGSQVFCNRDGIAETHWTTLAADMLMEA